MKVQDGCDAFCTYCIVPRARGVPRTVPLERVRDEVSALAAAGVGEVVLTGINIGRYDDAGSRLPDLLRAVASTGMPRIRLSSVEPGDVDDRLLAAASATGAFCPHLHVPLQSGSDGVLARMGRPYDTVSFAEIVTRARAAFPDIAVTTDVIVGFPGESDTEFEETLAFVEAIRFARLHVFRYSRREGTTAATMADQVAAPVSAARSIALRALGERLASAYATSQLGATCEVLVERVAPSGATVKAEGTSREYQRVRFVQSDVHPGDIRMVRIEQRAPEGVLVGIPAD